MFRHIQITQGGGVALAGSHSRSDPASPLCRNTYDCFPAINARHTSLKPCVCTCSVGLFFWPNKKGELFPTSSLTCVCHMRSDFHDHALHPLPFGYALLVLSPTSCPVMKTRALVSTSWLVPHRYIIVSEESKVKCVDMVLFLYYDFIMRWYKERIECQTDRS